MKQDGLRQCMMRAGALAFLALAACSPSPLPATSGRNTIEGCKAASEMAASVMRNRQADGDMAAAMQASSSPASRRIVQAAYAQPHYMTEEMQSRAIQDFKNDEFASCMKE